MASKRICSIDGCGKRSKSSLHCEKHWERLKKYGDPSFARATDKTFHEAMTTSSDECFLWQHNRDEHGYGLISGSKHQTRFVHRIICIETYGPPENQKMEAAHDCGNGHLGCVNPRHLSWKTRQGNIDDRRRHGTQQMGESIYNAKLKDSEIREIRSIQGWSAPEIAPLYGVHKANIVLIRSRKTWKHIP